MKRCPDQTQARSVSGVPYLSLSRDTQPWLEELLLLKARFTSSGCRKNLLAESRTRSTCRNIQEIKPVWSAVPELDPAGHGSSHLLLTDPGVLKENQADLRERSVQLCAQAAAEVQHRDAHVEAADTGFRTRTTPYARSENAAWTNKGAILMT